MTNIVHKFEGKKVRVVIIEDSAGVYRVGIAKVNRKYRNAGRYGFYHDGRTGKRYGTEVFHNAYHVAYRASREMNA